MGKAVALIHRTDGCLLVIRQRGFFQLPGVSLDGLSNPLTGIKTAVRRATGYTGLEWQYLGPRDTTSLDENRYYLLRGAERQAPVSDDFLRWIPGLTALARLAAFGWFEDFELVRAAVYHYVELYDPG